MVFHAKITRIVVGKWMSEGKKEKRCEEKGGKKVTATKFNKSGGFW
jgi:hypothetical protein